MSRYGTVILVVGALWVTALVTAALLLDERVAQWVQSTQPLNKEALPARVMSWPGVFYCTIAVAGAVTIIRRQWQPGAYVLLAGLFSSMNWLVKWFVGRWRPYRTPDGELRPFELEPFRDGFVGLFMQRNQAFPSGHAALAFATAVTLWILFPKGRPLYLAIAVIVACQRVLVNAHYVSDTIGGAAFGTVAAILAWRICRQAVDAGQQARPTLVTEQEESAAA